MAKSHAGDEKSRHADQQQDERRRLGDDGQAAEIDVRAVWVDGQVAELPMLKARAGYLA